MNRLYRLLAPLAALLAAAPALAQTVTVTAPNTVTPQGYPTTVNKEFTVNADGAVGNTFADGTPVTVTSQTAGGAVMLLVDTTGYRGVEFQLAIPSGGSVNFNSSNDGATWNAAPVLNNTTQSYGSGTGQTSATWYYPASTRWFRVTVGAAPGAAFTGTARLRQLNLDPASVAINGNVSTQGVVAPGATSNPNPVTIGGRESTTGTIRTLAVDTSGAVYGYTLGGGQANGATANPLPVVIGGRDGTGVLRTILTDGSGGVSVRANGDAGAGTTDAGNPVKIGGYASTAAPTAVSTGQRVNSWMTVNGATVAALGINSTMGDGTNNSAIAPIDISSSVGGGNAVQTKGYVFNPITSLWDRPRGTAAAGTLVSSGLSTALNITAATVVKVGAGKVARVSVLVGASGGAIYDTTTTGSIGAANAIMTIPSTPQVVDLDFPVANGIVVVPGAGSTVAISYN